MRIRVIAYASNHGPTYDFVHRDDNECQDLIPSLSCERARIVLRVLAPDVRLEEVIDGVVNTTEDRWRYATQWNLIQ